MLQPDGAAGGVLDQATVWVIFVDVPKDPVAMTLYPTEVVPVVGYSVPPSVHAAVDAPAQAPPAPDVELATDHAQLVAPVQFAMSVMGVLTCAALGPTIVQTGDPVAAQMLPAVPAATETRVGVAVATRLKGAMPAGQPCAHAPAEMKPRVRAEHASATQRIKNRFIGNSLAKRRSFGDPWRLQFPRQLFQMKTINYDSNYTPFLSEVASDVGIRLSVKRCRSAH
jgi:hypothetical protein